MKGLVIPTVAWLVIAVVAVIFLAIVFSMLVPAVGKFTTAVVRGLKDTFCNLLPWYTKWIFGC